MERLLQFLRGYSQIEVTGASPGWFLNVLTGMRIPFWDLVWVDALTIRFCMFHKDGKRVPVLAQKAMCEVTNQRRVGALQAVSGILKRRLLLSVLLVGLLLVLVLPNFVLFYEVEGNETVHDEEIIRALEELGIRFGTYGPSIKPQWVKDHVLNMVPELEWITVFQKGCRATVVVKERRQGQPTVDRKQLTNIVASQSGIITKQHILAGQALCQVGDTVSAGDLLVSGLVDLDRVWVMEHAEAEIYARTWRSEDLVVPAKKQKKTRLSGEKKTVWLCLGQKRIKLFGNSGISTGSCDKMIETKNLKLPGDLELPVTLVIETYVRYAESDVTMDEESAKLQLLECAQSRAMQDMRAGTILKQTLYLKETDPIYRVRVTLECHEMIAEPVMFQWNDEECQNDGKNGQR